MEVGAQTMSPERVLPEPEAEGQGPGGGQDPAAWSSEEEEEEEEQPLPEAEAEAGAAPGYRYLPLEQEPGAAPGHPEPDIGERLQELGLYLPEAPFDSEEEAEAASEHGSQQSIPMDPEHVELVKRTMAAIKFPSLGVPAWAQEISDEQWQSVVQQTIESRRSVVAAKE